MLISIKEMKIYRRTALSFLAIFLFSCAGQPAVREGGYEAGIPESFQQETGKALLPQDGVELFKQGNYLTIIAAGDNLYHEVMIRDGEDGDYLNAYSGIRSLTKKADIAFINQETLLAGKDFGFSGYPLFNSPQKLGSAISSVGFNIVNHATNHIMDKGEKAIIATMDFWDTIPEVTILGIHRSEEDRAIPRLVKKNNITLGFLSYSYGTNGIPVPADKTYLVSLIDTEIMAKEIDALRPFCDFLVVSMHWGEEYRTKISKRQEELAAFLAEHRVDLVIGHHPHVIQKMEYILRPDGRFMLCYYSLGNLISAQTQTPTLLGSLAYLRIKKTAPTGSRDRGNNLDDNGFDDNGPGEIVILSAGAIPVVTHYEKNFTGFGVYPLYDYTEELLEKHRKNQDKNELTMPFLDSTVKEILGNFAINKNPEL